MRDEHGEPSPLPADHHGRPVQDAGPGGVRYFASMIDAANAFVKATEPFKTVVYDDGCTVRHLNADELRLLENVCNMLGHDLEAVEG